MKTIAVCTQLKQLRKKHLIILPSVFSFPSKKSWSARGVASIFKKRVPTRVADVTICCPDWQSSDGGVLCYAGNWHSLVPRRFSVKGGMAGKQGARGMICIDPTTPCEPRTINPITQSASRSTKERRLGTRKELACSPAIFLPFFDSKQMQIIAEPKVAGLSKKFSCSMLPAHAFQQQQQQFI